jgi:hypothetical protein
MVVLDVKIGNKPPGNKTTLGNVFNRAETRA